MASEAIKELIAAAKIAQGWMTQSSRLAGTRAEEPCKSIHRRLGIAIDRVEAEEEPHQFGAHGTYRMRCNDCGQLASHPFHQIGGK